MRNSKYEKPTIIAVSYFIGFLTAFILFTNLVENRSEETNINSEQIQPTVTVTPPVIKRTQRENDNDFIPYDYSDGKLVVFSKSGLEIISTNVDTAEINNTDSHVEQGINYSIPAISLSNDQNYLYFCEQPYETADFCTGYVYDYVNETINPVMINDQPFVPVVDLAMELKWSDEGMNLADMYSLNPNEPWLLTDRENR